MPAPSLKIFFHDRCFDGAASAAVFADFFRETRGPAAIRYRGMSHSQGDPFKGVDIDGDENACVDFRYTAHPKMNWWFDHHISGFQPASLQEHFEADRGSSKFYDPTAQSCALFIHETLRDRFGYLPEDPGGHWAELVTWADKIDGAAFESASEIVDLDSAALQLMLWLKRNRDADLAAKLIECMGQMSLAAIVETPWIQVSLPGLLDAHRRSTDLIAQQLRFDGLVAYYDLSEHQADSSNGFAVYVLQPDCVYSIGLSSGSTSVSISVGRNPWVKDVGTHNLARICETYGGGGHPHVGGITMPVSELGRAREIVEEIRRKLNRDEVRQDGSGSPG